MLIASAQVFATVGSKSASIPETQRRGGIPNLLRKANAADKADFDANPQKYEPLVWSVGVVLLVGDEVDPDLPVYTVTYDANGGTGTIAPATKVHDLDLSLPYGFGFIHSGYTFAGWNTDANGTGTYYDPGASYKMNADLTLYAMWTVSTAVDQFVTDETSIYPNPTDNWIFFRNVPEDSQVALVDMSGRNLLVKKASELEEGLSLQPFANGYYMIRVIHRQGFVTSVKVLKI